jgi:hypothetical protein
VLKDILKSINVLHYFEYGILVYMVEKIQPLEDKTQGEKMLRKIRNFLTVRAVAYGVGAVAGVGAGTLVQQGERDVTGYDPITHQAFVLGTNKPVTDLESFKQEKKDKEKRSVKEWASDTLRSLKSKALNPKEAIQGTEMYREVMMKYLATLKFIDDVSFLAPALLMFVMLGGYLTRTLTKIVGTYEEQEEKNKVIDKINELVQNANSILEIIEQRGVESLSASQIKEIKAMLQDGAKALPDENI